MAESKCGRYSIRDRIYYGRLFIGSKNKLVQRANANLGALVCRITATRYPYYPHH